MQPVPMSNLPPVALGSAPTASRSRVRLVLVVSMDASLRESLRYHLTGLRWQVLEAPGGAEAWMAASEASQLEALLIDSWLPDLDVNEFLADFRRDYPQVDIVMTDGVPTRDGPKSAYRQELLYALRRTQDGDTALWQSAPAILDTPAISDLPPLGQRRSPAATTSSSPSQARFAAQAADRMADRISERSPGLPASPSFSQPVSQLEPQSGTRAEVRSQAGGPVPSDSTANHAIQSLPTIQSQSAGPRRNGYSPTLSPVDRSLMEASRPAELIGEGAPVPPAETLGPNRGELRAPGRAAGAQREALGWEPLPTLIGNSHAMLEVSRRIRLVAGRTTPVLIEGPTGSGKELVAAGLHRLSERSRKPMIAINCAAIPEPLLEAELFGHTRGAFTGAVTGRVGRIEAADGGTLFLDEIGEMPLGLQSKLLRFFESGEHPSAAGRTCPTGSIPGRSLLPPRRVSDSDPGSGRTHGRPAVAGAALPGTDGPEVAGEAPALFRDGAPRRAWLAGECPGAGACSGASRHPCGRQSRHYRRRDRFWTFAAELR